MPVLRLWPISDYSMNYNRIVPSSSPYYGLIDDTNTADYIEQALGSDWIETHFTYYANATARSFPAGAKIQNIKISAAFQISSLKGGGSYSGSFTYGFAHGSSYDLHTQNYTCSAFATWYATSFTLTNHGGSLWVPSDFTNFRFYLAHSGYSSDGDHSAFVGYLYADIAYTMLGGAALLI